MPIKIAGNNNDNSGDRREAAASDCDDVVTEISSFDPQVNLRQTARQQIPHGRQQ